MKEFNGRKNLLKATGILLIAAVLVLSSTVVATNRGNVLY